MKQCIKNAFCLFIFAYAAAAATAGEIGQFISETMAERRAQNAREAVNTEAKSEIQQIVLPESKLSAKTKSLKSRSYRYDKAGRLVSVISEACPELNESYVYDKQGNILEKRVGDKVYTYKYDTANQLASMESAEGLREYVYDMAGRLIEEKLNGKTDVKYTYGYLDKVTEVNRRGNITKFVYDGVGMLASKISSDGKVENWMWDGLALIRRGKDIHINEPHISGGVPIVSRTPNGTQFHESDFLGTTLWSIDTKGNVVSFQNDTIFGDGTIKTNRCARFTGKPYDEDLQAFVFPCRNYNTSTARWQSSDPAGYPDGVNQHFYAAVPTAGLDPLGCWRANGIEYNIDGHTPASDMRTASLAPAYFMAYGYILSYTAVKHLINGTTPGISNIKITAFFQNSIEVDPAFSAIRNKVHNLVKAKNGDSVNINFKQGITFQSGDLLYALRNISMNVKGTITPTAHQNEDGSTYYTYDSKLALSFYDSYDFKSGENWQIDVFARLQDHNWSSAFGIYGTWDGSFSGEF